MHRSHLQEKHHSKQMGRDFDVRGQQEMGQQKMAFFYWRKYYFGLKTGILVKSESMKLKRLDGLFYLNLAI